MFLNYCGTASFGIWPPQGGKWRNVAECSTEWCHMVTSGSTYFMTECGGLCITKSSPRAATWRHVEPTWFYVVLKKIPRFATFSLSGTTCRHAAPLSAIYRNVKFQKKFLHIIITFYYTLLKKGNFKLVYLWSVFDRIENAIKIKYD